MPFRIEFKRFEVPLPEIVVIREAAIDDADSWERTWKSWLVWTAADDALWDWHREVEIGRTLDGRLCVAAAADDRLEGLMSLSIDDSRMEPGRSLVYVEYIAVAPWNRREFGAKAKIRGVGKTLLRAAVRISVDLELEGRIGLHSKPASEAFYREKLKLVDLGPEVVDDGEWVYFEATPEVAKGLL